MKPFFYINETIKNGWSRAVLRIQIETNLYSRQGRALTNFENTLPQILLLLGDNIKCNYLIKSDL